LPADLVGEDVEAGRSAGLEGVFSFHHALVDLGPALDVVGPDGQQFLEEIGSADRGIIGFSSFFGPEKEN
jgi:hypothetical protein